MSGSKPLRIGMIQLGHGHCNGVLEALWAHPELEFVGAWEPDAAMVERRKGQHPRLRLVDRPEALLDDPAVDALVLEGQNSENQPWAMRALEAGKDLRIEKCVDVRVEGIEEIGRLARQRGRVVQAGYTYVYNPGLRKLREIAEAGLLGAVFQARGRMSLGLGSYDNAEFYLPGNPGGTTFDEATNLLAVMIPILGDPVRATGLVGRHHRRDRMHDDNGVLLVEFGSSLATLESCHMEADHFATRTVQLFGEKGTAIVEPLEPPELRLFLNEANGGYAAGWQRVAIEPEHRHAAEIDDWVRCIRTRERPRADLRLAARTLGALLAAYEGTQNAVAIPARDR